MRAQELESAPAHPFVRIIMPVRNEAATIAYSVNAVLSQTYPASCYEIIIADGMSDDATVEIIRRLPDAKRIMVIPNERRTQSCGLNRALEVSRGDVVIRVDGHTVIHTDYVQRCVKALMSTGATNVGGAINPVALTTTGKAIAVACRSRFAIPSTFRTSTKSQNTDTVYMGTWWRSTFDRVGKFDEDFRVNEDYELNYRIRASGGRVMYRPEICSLYYGQQNLLGLARQHFRYGCGKPKTIHKHPASIRLRHLIAPLWISSMSFSSLFSVNSQEAACFCLAIAALYCLTNLAFSFRLARENDNDLLLRLPLIFLIIHVAWGLGFWCGVGHLVRRQFAAKSLSLP